MLCWYSATPELPLYPLSHRHTASSGEPAGSMDESSHVWEAIGQRLDSSRGRLSGNETQQYSLLKRNYSDSVIATVQRN